MHKNSEPLPASGCSFGAGLVSSILFILLSYLSSSLGWISADVYSIKEVVIFSLVTIVPSVLYDMYRSLKGEGGAGDSPLSCKFQRKACSRRIGVKILGLTLCIALCAGLYALLPEYKRPLYADYLQMILSILPWLAVFSLPYIWYLDRAASEEKDGAWHVGAFVLRMNECSHSECFNHIRGWIVKLFFLPLMLNYMIGNMKAIAGYDYSSFIFDLNNVVTYKRMFDYLYTICFTVDLYFACVGYVLTLKILNSHIKSAEPTVKGWLVCILCYEPFWGAVFYERYFAYNDSFYWGDAFWNHTLIYALWGGVVIALLACYALASVACGYRFSNLTYRGLYSSGPYKFTKHPAYVCKNISWWLVSVPFIANGSASDALRDCLLLFGVNVIYFLRARTEEAHLSKFEEYRQYALIMNERSVFAPLGRIVPALRFKAPSNVSLMPLDVQSRDVINSLSHQESSGVLCPAVPSPSV